MFFVTSVAIMIVKTKQISRFLLKIPFKVLNSAPAMSLSVVFVAATLGALFITPVKQASIADYNLFNDVQATSSLSANISGGALINTNNIIENEAWVDDFAGFALVEKGSYLNSTPSSEFKIDGGLLTYKIESGESIGVIAQKFGISTNTILWANNLKSSKLIRPGQEIVILPVSGVLHEVKQGESIQTIADLYGISSGSIVSFNKSRVIEGDTVIIPNGKPINAGNNASNLPDIGSYLAFPIKDGWNWGKLHQSAVDISSACGTPIYASAEGLVTSTGSPKNWNSGAGGYIRIKHPLGEVETFYAHNSKNLVSKGDYVSRGDQIALVGNTGLVQGPTGCHVHFAVYGAKHPFAK